MLREVVNFRIIPEEEAWGGIGQISGETDQKELDKLVERIFQRGEKYFWDDYPSHKLKESGYNILLISLNPTRSIYYDIQIAEWLSKEYYTTKYKCKFLFAFTKDSFQRSFNLPVKLGNDSKSPNKVYWLYNEKVYWENDNLDAESIKALINARESKKQRKVEFLKGPEKKHKSRRYIEDDVKVAVWRRDNARCVKCGSNKDLEFDHIIPVSMGGSSTERNLQLLCERCNREKGADLK